MPISNLISMSIKRCVFAASVCTSSNSWCRRDLVGIKQLHTVFTVLIVSRVLYALPAWGGFLSSDLLNKIDSILRKAHKFGYTTEVLKVTDMLQNADISSFRLYSDLVTAFIHYFPTSKWLTLSSATLELLPHCSYKLYKQSFVNKMSFSRLLLTLFWSLGHICYLIWFDVSFFLHIIGWRLSVSINDMSCYVILYNNVKVGCRRSSIERWIEWLLVDTDATDFEWKW